MDTMPGISHWGDITVVVIYFVAVLGVGVWTLFRPNRGSVQSYFLAGRNMKWWPVGASLFSSNIGSEHFVGLAGTGAASGIAMVLYEWNFDKPYGIRLSKPDEYVNITVTDFIEMRSMFLVILLAWLFVPVYVSAGVYTLPEYMAKRFGGNRLRVYLSCLSLILYIVTKLAVSIYAGALFIKLALGWNMYLSIAGLLLITGFYTVLGGLAAVIFTDALQTVIMTAGAVVLTVISFNKIGGYRQLVYRYMMAVPSSPHNMSTTCGQPREDAFHIFRDPVTSDNPWPGLFLQSSLGVMWYWCCDQVIVQRSLAAKNLSHAKAGSILAGYLKLTPLFFMIFPGMISRALYPDVIACVDPAKCQQYCETSVGCSNVAYPKLVLELMPVGLRGLLMAVMLSAIMSSLTSIFNSSATLFTMDLWRRLRTRATERELLIVGRLFILIMCGVAILWIPLVRSSQGGQLFNYIQAVQGYLGTPIGAIFILAILWKRMNETGAFYGLLVGHVCGIVRMSLDFVYPAPGCDEPDTRPSILSAVHYTYFGSLSLGITVITIIVFTLATRRQEEEQLWGVTWWTRVDCIQKNVEKVAVSDGDLNPQRDTDADEPVEIVEGKCHRWFDKVCGIPLEQGKSKHTPEITVKERRAYLKEQPRWKTVLNINAAIAMAVTAFLIGFYH